jgi:hypothetical protein
MPVLPNTVAPGDHCAAVVTSLALTRQPRYSTIYGEELVDQNGVRLGAQRARALNNRYNRPNPTERHDLLCARVWSLDWVDNEHYPRCGYYNMMPDVDFFADSPISLECNRTLIQMAESLRSNGYIENDYQHQVPSYCGDKITLNFPGGTQLPGQRFFICRRYLYVQRFSSHL